MYPHERSLVAELKDEPFALLGVNSDPLEKVRAAKEEKNLSWRSWWDGGDTRGPIATRWAVTGWPTIYVLDHNGIIRYQGVRGEEMDKTIHGLLAEMKAEGIGSDS